MKASTERKVAATFIHLGYTKRWEKVKRKNVT